MDAVVFTPAKVVMHSATTTAASTAAQTGLTLMEWIKSIASNLPNIVDLGIGLGTTLWFYYLLKVPWNLYLSARRIRIEGEESIEQGIKPDEGNLEKIRKMEFALFVGVCAAHVMSAVGVYGLAWLTEERFIKKSTSLLFVGAAFVRPALEYKRHILARIETLRSRIRYPTNHVQIMLQKIDDLTSRVTALEEDNKRHNKELAQLLEKTVPEINSTISALTRTEESHHRQLSTKIASDVEALKNQASSDRANVTSKFQEVSKKFESTIIELSADKKILEGIRGFLGIVKESLWEGSRQRTDQ